MLFLISESLAFIAEFIYIHIRNNPYISLFKSGIFLSKFLIIKGTFTSFDVKKGVMVIVFSLFLVGEMIIFSDMIHFLSGDVLIIVISYLLILFNLFSRHNFDVRRKIKSQNGKMKVFSDALFEEMFSHNGKPIFIIKNNIKSIKLEMIKDRAASIFGLENIINLDYELLKRSFLTKFSGFSSYSSSSFKGVKQNQVKDRKKDKKNDDTDQELIETVKKEDEMFKVRVQVSINDLIEDFRRDQKVKRIELFLKNQDESLNHYSFDIFKVKHAEKNYFIFLIHDQSKIDELENLKNINQFNSRLLCSLSHEIKTPINGALPNLEILKGYIENHELSELLDISIGSLKILENSLDNIMAFNLLQTNQILLSQNKFDLQDLLGEISNIISPMIKIKKLNFSIKADSLPKIKVASDYIKLKQILLNLLTNAIQFTFAGDIFLKIELKEESLIKFFVKDTGIGMDFLKLNKLIKKLKEPNQENLEINSSGSCMGLVISEKLSILLGSEKGLRIVSTLNEGSEFTFSIINNDNYFDISDNENRCITKRFISSKSSASMRNSLLRVTSFIEEKKHSHLIEHKLKKSTFVIDDGEHQGIKSLKSVSCLSSNNIMEENTKTKYNFEPLVKRFDHLDNPTSVQLNNPLSTDPNIKKIIFHDCNYNSVNSVCYGNIEKEAVIKLSPIAYSQKHIFGQTKKKTICDCEEIMYVDDDAFNLLSLELILKTFNLKCCKVMNGLEAVRILEKKICENIDCRGFKLIFMDYQMPIMDGIEATIKIMEMIRNNLIDEVPIIGCTAFVTKDEILKCYDVGMKDVIFKPLNINLVKNILKEWL